jgi:hypothetical protein
VKLGKNVKVVNSGSLFRSSKLFLVSFFILNSLWVFASPVGSAPDEPAHIAYSWATITGQTFSESSSPTAGTQKVTQIHMPAKLKNYPDPGCYAFKPSVSVGACGDTKSDYSVVGTITSSYMTGYPPTYYLIQGVPLLLAKFESISGENVLILSRLFNYIVCSSLIFIALAKLNKIYNSKAIMLGLITLFTPMVSFLFGSINSSGFEICTGFLYMSLLICQLHKSKNNNPIYKKDLILIFLVSILFATSRPLSWVWMIIGLIMFLILLLQKTGETSIKSYTNKKSTTFSKLRGSSELLLIITFPIAIGFLFFVRFMLLRNDDVISTSEERNWSGLNPLGKIFLLLIHFGIMLQHGIGVLGWLDTELPFVAYAFWIFAISIMVNQVLKRNETWSNPTYALSAGIGLILISTLILEYVSNFGWQGRYLLPLLGMLIVIVLPHLSHLFVTDLIDNRLIPFTVRVILSLNIFSLFWFVWRNMYGVSVFTGNRIPAAPLPLGDATWHPRILGYSLFILLILTSAYGTLRGSVSSLKK